MSGINYYPSRDQGKYQRVVQTNSNIALTAKDMGSMFYCYSGSTQSITLSEAEDNKIPVGAQVDFLRLNADVQFSAASGSIVYESSVGATPKIRVTKAACSFVKMAVGEWIIIGDIVAS
jgi:hypothetical protein